MAAPSIQRAVLLIADIGGYTRFMKLTRTNLAHAQQVVADLLEAVIDAAGPLRLSKLEGDAALFWTPVADDAKALREVSRSVLAIRAAFLKKRTQMLADITCDCESCLQIKNLKIKFVAHEGEVALQRVKRHTELAGVDVILVHRMLKNDVPVTEYVLMTDQVHQALPDDLKGQTQSLEHDFEGIGQVQTHYADLAQVSTVAPFEPKRSSARRLWETVRLTASVLPEILGLRKPLDGYHRTLAAIEPAEPGKR